MSEAAEENAVENEMIEDSEERLAAAMSTVRSHMYVSMGTGVIPLPVVDLVALTGVQMNMARKLSQYYGITFKENLVKNIVASLVGSVLPIGFAGGVGSMVKAVPFISGLAVLTMPALAGAATYALGKVFILHFESGGTFLDFDVEKMREHFQEEMKSGKSKAKAA